MSPASAVWLHQAVDFHIIGCGIPNTEIELLLAMAEVGGIPLFPTPACTSTRPLTSHWKADQHLVSQSEIAARADSRPPTWAALMRRLTPIGKGCLLDRNRARPGRTCLKRRMVQRPHAQTAQREVCTTAPGRWRGARRWRR